MIEQAYEQAEAAGIVQLNEDEAGPYQAIPQPGASWQPEGRPALQPHEYERGGTAKLLTLFRPVTGEIRAKGVVSVTNEVLHPWLKEQLGAVLAEIEQEHPAETLPLEAERPRYAQWETWLGHPPRTPKPPLRIVLVLDNLAGHRSYDLVQWFFQHGVMPLYTPVGGSWLNMAESVQRIIVPRAQAFQHPTDARAYHRLVRANGGRLEHPPHAVCVEWQATPTPRTSSPPPPGWLRCSYSGLQSNCQLTH